MAQEIDDGIAYLRSLKQSASPPAAAPPQETTSPQQAGSQTGVADGFKASDKRRSPRYKCEGSAELRKEGCDVRTWATFSDISLHGCYVEAQATYPAGTVLQMKLEANGVRVETKGKVRVSYPYLGMGVAFAEMSDESLARLRGLLASLSASAVIMGPGIASSLLANGPLDAVCLPSRIPTQPWRLSLSSSKAARC
jgi:hypothetical protein